MERLAWELLLADWAAQGQAQQVEVLLLPQGAVLPHSVAVQPRSARGEARSSCHSPCTRADEVRLDD